MSYDTLWQNFSPDPIDAQIKEIERELCIRDAVLRKQEARGQIHPNVVRERMHLIRSVLFTLRQARDAGAPPAPAPVAVGP